MKRPPIAKQPASQAPSRTPPRPPVKGQGNTVPVAAPQGAPRPAAQPTVPPQGPTAPVKGAGHPGMFKSAPKVKTKNADAKVARHFGLGAAVHQGQPVGKIEVAEGDLGELAAMREFMRLLNARKQAGNGAASTGKLKPAQLKALQNAMGGGQPSEVPDAMDAPANNSPMPQPPTEVAPVVPASEVGPEFTSMVTEEVPEATTGSMQQVQPIASNVPARVATDSPIQAVRRPAPQMQDVPIVRDGEEVDVAVADLGKEVRALVALGESLVQEEDNPFKAANILVAINGFILHVREAEYQFNTTARKSQFVDDLTQIALCVQDNLEASYWIFGTLKEGSAMDDGLNSVRQELMRAVCHEFDQYVGMMMLRGDLANHEWEGSRKTGKRAFKRTPKDVEAILGRKLTDEEQSMGRTAIIARYYAQEQELAADKQGLREQFCAMLDHISSSTEGRKPFGRTQDSHKTYLLMRKRLENAMDEPDLNRKVTEFCIRVQVADALVSRENEVVEAALTRQERFINDDGAGDAAHNYGAGML